MTTRSLTHSRFYKVVAVVLSAVLTCSLVPPQGWGLLFNTSVAYAASETGLAPALPSTIVQASQNRAVMGESTSPFKMDASGINEQFGETNAGMLQVQHGASSLMSPLSISRVQSAYRSADAISGTLVVTFTVTGM